ncbi:MAG: YHS domain-containing (seleno)protein [Cyclobacteriaceae bacterium]
MKTTIKKWAFVFACLIATGLMAQDKMAFNIDNSNIALDGYSPVSYLDLGLAQRGSKEFKSEYNKVVFYFTSQQQKEKFNKNPERYLPQYGGYCAFGIYAGAKFRTDPNKFIVRDDKYYLFLYNVELDAQQLWLDEKDDDKLIKKADENWKKLRSSYN